MDSKQSGSNFSSNILSRSFDDDRSVGSAKSGKPLLAQLFFQNTEVKVAEPIGEVSLSTNYPLTDKSWSFWLTDHHVNDHKLSEHEKCNIESLNQDIHHQNAVIEKLEQLLERHQGSDQAETTQQVMTNVFDALQSRHLYCQ